MPEKLKKWTTDQKTAIESLSDDMVVSASAGTGKTAVLTHRCVRLLADPEKGANVSQLLVLTFTEAAADEMKQRVDEQLRQASLQGRHSHLRKHLLLLETAQISTIHSFCRRLITDYFYLLDIDPAFKVIDDDEQRLIKADILARVIREGFEDDEVSSDIRNLFYRRLSSPSGGFFANTLISIYNYLDSLPSRPQWIQSALTASDQMANTTGTVLQEQKAIIHDGLKQIQAILKHAHMMMVQKELPPEQIEIIDSYLEQVVKSLLLLEHNKFDQCREVLKLLEIKPFRKSKKVSKQDADDLNLLFKEANACRKKLLSYVLLNLETFHRYSDVFKKHSRAMIYLIQKFDSLYTSFKRAIHVLDFADLQQLTLKLFMEQPQVLKKLIAQYRYIFVDEYQDINKLQQTLIQSLCRENHCFTVGDIKQSIYAFRQADPVLFLQRLNQAGSDKKDRALRVDLSHNFRSHQGILDFVNRLFARIMKPPLSSVDYDQRHWLKSGITHNKAVEISDGDVPAVELTVITEEDERTESLPASDRLNMETSEQKQAWYIADRIHELMGKKSGFSAMQIKDKQTGNRRPLEFRDIVILMRSPANRAKEYVEVLQHAGIPVETSSASGYFQTTELTDCLAMLKVIDNPRQDIELATVLRSPFFSITDDQLVQLRVHDTDAHSNKSPAFYDCLVHYCQTGPDEKLKSRLQTIVSSLNKWRTMARQDSVANLFWHILRKTRYLSFVAALPNGSQRRANLLKLHDRAIQFDGFATSSKVVSLNRFVAFIEKLIEEGHDWSPAEPDSAAENAVRIMSIHKSKGLEFPVVFLSQLETRFNIQDTKHDCLVDNTAVGLRIIDHESAVKLSDPVYQNIQSHQQQQQLSEELRILYVAVTRAREKLIMTACSHISECRQLLQRCAINPDQSISTWQLLHSKSHFQWLLYGLAEAQHVTDVFGSEIQDAVGDDDTFRVSRVSQNQLTEMVKLLTADVQKEHSFDRNERESVQSLLKCITENLKWSYPNLSQVHQKAKASVSELTHRDDEFARLNLNEVFKAVPNVFKQSTVPYYQAAAIGSAVHLVLEKIDIFGPVTDKTIQHTIEMLVKDNLLPSDIGGAIPIEAIMRFFNSYPGSLLLDSDNRIHREWQFTWLADQDAPIVQGIIDCMVETPNGLILIDYKTDHIDKEHVMERAKLYEQQLKLYAQAAASICGKRILECLLYFLNPGIAIKIDSD